MGDPWGHDTHPSENDLQDFAIGKLTDLRAAMVERHVGQCDQCAAAVSNSPPDAFVALLADTEETRSTVAGCALPAADDETEAGPRLPRKAVQQIPITLRDHPRFRVIRWLADGGMGTVFLAEHRLLRIPVALKTVRATRAGDGKSLDRFLQEAKVAAQLNHPNIARVFDAEQIGEALFLAIEYVPGQTLAQLVAKKGPLPVSQACEYIRQAGQGLDHAAGRGVVHRDIKPQNLMLMLPEGAIKILDFGLGRLVDEERSHGRLTNNDDLLGTPHFIAPEQIRDSRTADARSDIYGLGCTFYYILAGEGPFQGSNPLELLEKHANQPPPSIRSLRRDVSAEVDRLILAMLAKDPRQRPQTSADMMQALARINTASASASAPHAQPKRVDRKPSHMAATRFAWSRIWRSPIVMLPLLTFLLTLLALFVF
jgi:eukaryotic-like serine/threonine-protein kinase